MCPVSLVHALAATSGDLAIRSYETHSSRALRQVQDISKNADLLGVALGRYDLYGFQMHIALGMSAVSTELAL